MSGVTSVNSVGVEVVAKAFDLEPLAAGGKATSPLAIATALLGAATVVRAVRVRAFRRVLRAVDGPGAVLVALGLGGIVLAFSVADPRRHAIAPNGPYLLTASAVFFGLFAKVGDYRMALLYAGFLFLPAAAMAWRRWSRSTATRATPQAVQMP